jgi:hypothetical protein
MRESLSALDLVGHHRCQSAQGDHDGVSSEVLFRPVMTFLGRRIGPVAATGDGRKRIDCFAAHIRESAPWTSHMLF